MKTARMLWENKGKILNGFTNKYINFWDRRKVKKIADLRIAICRTNTCGYYDPHGTFPISYFPGVESCGGCGCKLSEKTFSMNSYCFLKDIHEAPLWETAKEEKSISTINNKAI